MSILSLTQSHFQHWYQECSSAVIPPPPSLVTILPAHTYNLTFWVCWTFNPGYLSASFIKKDNVSPLVFSPQFLLWFEPSNFLIFMWVPCTKEKSEYWRSLRLRTIVLERGHNFRKSLHPGALATSAVDFWLVLIKKGILSKYSCVYTCVSGFGYHGSMEHVNNGFCWLHKEPQLVPKM